MFFHLKESRFPLPPCFRKARKTFFHLSHSLLCLLLKIPALFCHKEKRLPKDRRPSLLSVFRILWTVKQKSLRPSKNMRLWEILPCSLFPEFLPPGLDPDMCRIKIQMLPDSPEASHKGEVRKRDKAPPSHREAAPLPF